MVQYVEVFLTANIGNVTNHFKGTVPFLLSDRILCYISLLKKKWTLGSGRDGEFVKVTIKEECVAYGTYHLKAVFLADRIFMGKIYSSANFFFLSVCSSSNSSSMAQQHAMTSVASIPAAH